MQADYKNITNKIKEIILKTDSSAQIVLYGSRARGDAKKNSDWDVLILVDKPKVTFKDEQLFRHSLYDLTLETGQSISTFVYSKKDWDTNNPLLRFIITLKKKVFIYE